MHLPNHKTKIVATIGPASDSPEMLRAVIEAGMHVARLNFSHGDPRYHSALIGRIREAAKATGQRVAIMGDLPGPKMRIGDLVEVGGALCDHRKALAVGHRRQFRGGRGRRVEVDVRDAGEHVARHRGLGVLAFACARFALPRVPLLFAALAIAIFAVGTEAAQFLVWKRQPTLIDVGIDLAGPRPECWPADSASHSGT
ncbi:MAG: VanZ family protein [Acidobacteria bacterium]|nr:VanZ family protein [Acidobacteriota bacterium]